MIANETRSLPRAARRLFGNDDRQPEQADAGFTLIELMVVLLILGILLAVAVPTFLSVSTGARSALTQTDLANSLTTLQSIYNKDDGAFPTTLDTLLAKTESAITYVDATVAPTPGKNMISVWRSSTNEVGMWGVDGADKCWFVYLNETSKAISGVPPGYSYGSFQASSTTWRTCSATSAGVTLAGYLWPSFAAAKTARTVGTGGHLFISTGP